MITQAFTSKMTSINSSKLPAIYKKINWKHLSSTFDHIPTVLDYGCGRYTDHIKEFMSSFPVNWIGYDKYWNPGVDLERWYDIIICSNVLNVIKENEVVTEIHDYLRKHSYFYFITVYEGNKTLVGHSSGPDKWQRNETLDIYGYCDEFLRKKVLTNRNGEFFVV